MKMMGLAHYARDTTPFFAANDFYEVEIGRRIDLFGNIAHVWSAYEARRSPDDAEPERRGINSIQLFRDPDAGWRIMAMIWDNEREGVGGVGGYHSVNVQPLHAERPEVGNLSQLFGGGRPEMIIRRLAARSSAGALFRRQRG